MKISMWMIANRLESLDPELHIGDDAGMILQSARKAYARDCVMIYQNGADAVCEYGTDTIIVHDMSASEFFEVVQGVFDYYDNWIGRFRELIGEDEFQSAVDLCWPIFHNPMVIINGNYQRIASSSQYSADGVDPEWKHLMEYGCSSVASVRRFKKDLFKILKPNTSQYFHTENTSLNSGISYYITVGNAFFGRATVLEKDRNLNPGDAQILQIAGDCIRNHLEEKESGHAGQIDEPSALDGILDGKSVDENQAREQLNYLDWDVSDRYSVYVFEFIQSIDIRYHFNRMLSQSLREEFPWTVTKTRDGKVVLIQNETHREQKHDQMSLENIAARNDVRIGVSLAGNGIFTLSNLYRQAKAAIDYGRILDAGKKVFRFYDYAVAYIIESKSLAVSVLAVHPDVLEFYTRKRNGDGMLFDTLKKWLANERSQSRTARELKIHRNSLQYRITKLEEQLHYSLDDVYTREYMQLSIETLELCRIRNEEESVRKGLSDEKNHAGSRPESVG